jgi:non-canonical poly(A) RNA polymerase PAPD5/7
MEVDQENLQIPETIVYTTLSPLPLTTDDSPDDSSNHEQYSVFRNEISLDTPQVDSIYSTAPDFFSLDVNEEAEPEAENPLPEPITPVEPKTPAIENEPTLEGGWFRGNCKFRSPMLQLHKGSIELKHIVFCFGA